MRALLLAHVWALQQDSCDTSEQLSLASAASPRTSEAGAPVVPQDSNVPKTLPVCSDEEPVLNNRFPGDDAYNLEPTATSVQCEYMGQWCAAYTWDNYARKRDKCCTENGCKGLLHKDQDICYADRGAEGFKPSEYCTPRTASSPAQVQSRKPEWKDYRPWAKEVQERPPPGTVVQPFDLAASVVGIRKVIRVPLDMIPIHESTEYPWRKESDRDLEWKSIRSWRVIVHIEPQEKWTPWPEGDPETFSVAYRCGDAPVWQVDVLNKGAEESFFCQPSHWDREKSRPSCVFFEVDAKANDWCEVVVLRNDHAVVAEALETEETCGAQQRCCTMAPEDTKKNSIFKKNRKGSEGPKYPAKCVQEELALGKSTCKAFGGTKVDHERCVGSGMFTNIGTIFPLFSKHAPSVGDGCGRKERCCRWREPLWYHIERASGGLQHKRKQYGVADGPCTKIANLTKNVLAANDGIWRIRKGEESVAAAVAATCHGGLAKSMLMNMPDFDDGYHACIRARECPDLPSLDPRYDDLVLKGEVADNEMCTAWPQYTRRETVRRTLATKQREADFRALRQVPGE